MAEASRRGRMLLAALSAASGVLLPNVVLTQKDEPLLFSSLLSHMFLDEHSVSESLSLAVGGPGAAAPVRRLTHTGAVWIILLSLQPRYAATMVRA